MRGRSPSPLPPPPPGAMPTCSASPTRPVFDALRFRQAHNANPPKCTLCDSKIDPCSCVPAITCNELKTRSLCVWLVGAHLGTDSCGIASPVTSIDMPSCGLRGAIPDSFGNLRFLEYLNLADNEITGGLPKTMGRGVAMTELEMRGNIVPPQGCREEAGLVTIQSYRACPVRRPRRIWQPSG